MLFRRKVSKFNLFIHLFFGQLVYCIFFFGSIVPFQICLNETNILCVYVYIDKVSKELQKKYFLKVIKKKNRLKKGAFFQLSYALVRPPYSNNKLRQIALDSEV